MSSFRLAVRSGAQLLVAIWGDSGAGKTRSGLAVARGIAADPGEDFNNPETLRAIDRRIFVVDTDAGRAEHYAPAEGEAPRADRFAFQHAELEPPFTTARYLALVQEAVEAGARVILTDSISMLWDGEGGCVDWHAQNVADAVERARKRWEAGPKRYPFDEDYEGDKASVGAWKEPKVDWRRMESRLLQLRTHLIFCGHADDKLRLEKEVDDQGRETKKTRVVQPKEKPIKDRWEPIAEKKFKRRLVVSLILTPEEPGVPHVHKPMDPELAACIPLDRQLNANVGLRLATWARGAKAGGPRPANTKKSAPPASGAEGGAPSRDGESLGGDGAPPLVQGGR